MKPIFNIIIGVIIGTVLTAFYLSGSSGSDAPTSEANKQPLYWVAPMDPNYRRDQPGKSPMGMDLIPVYADDESSQAGLVSISPDVINNLGVRTTIVSRQNLHMPINTVGYVRYNEDTLVHIHPRVEGWVDTLYVKTAGQKVEKGEPLYALYSPQLVNAQEEYLLAKNRHNSGLSAAALERLKALQMPPQSIEQLAKTGKVQQTVVFYAPQSGVVDNLNIREGFYVKPGTTLLSIGALDQVWVEAEVFERQAALVKTGLSASMTLGFLPGEIWQGQLDYVYPTLDPGTRTLRVRLRFANPQRKLKPNMFAQIIIHSDAESASLVVPKEAVIRSGKQDRVVLALGQGRFKSVEVKLGLVGADKIQILSGLQEGDEVVSSAQFLLDSESSISSDFIRMHHTQDEPIMSEATAADEIQRATVNGRILHIDQSTRILTIHRDAIEKWQRPAATMDFILADSIDMAKLVMQQTVNFSFEIHAGEFVITAITPIMAEHNHQDMQP